MHTGLIRRAAAAVLCAFFVLPAWAANTGTGVPVAENLELTTYRETSVGGRMAAVDPDGESVRFLVTTQPSKGTLEASEDGRFVYTPGEGKRGRDYFGYKAVDASGNLSQEATVILHIKKRPACVEYADTAGLPWDYAACVLASEGVFTGSCVAGHYLFEPDRTVSQGEFLTLCMTAAGVAQPSETPDTTPAAEGLPGWLQSYVSTAILEGYAGFGPDTPVFEAQEPLLREDAALILRSILQPTGAVGPDLPQDPKARAMADLAACGVMDGGLPGGEPLTRGETAQLLVRSLELLRSR